MNLGAGALALLLLTTSAAFDGTALAEEARPGRPAIEFADGVPVTFTSKDPSTEIYLAHGDVPVGTTPDRPSR